MPTDKIEIKQALWAKCLEFAEEMLSNATQAVDRAEEAAKGEDKSTAGDKHDVTREMMQAEKVKAQIQQDKALKLVRAIKTVKPDVARSKVQTGSLVYTNHGSFYISISAGKMEHQGQKYVAMALAAPLAKHLEGSQKGDSVRFNGKAFSILEVY